MTTQKDAAPDYCFIGPKELSPEELIRAELEQAIKDRDALKAELEQAKQDVEHFSLSHKRLAEAELEQLRKIAKLCRREMEHGFDLPSDVFDEVEVYYEAHGVFDCDCDDCVALERGGSNGQN